MKINPSWELETTLGFGIASAVAHILVHYGFVTPQRAWEIGAVQASIPIFAAVALAVYGTSWAANKYSGIKMFLFAGVLWVSHAVAHDGTHLLYIPFELVSQFGAVGVPESGITIAIIQLAAIIYVYREKFVR